MLADSPDQTFPVQQLLKASAFPHPVDEIRLLETHISWVILTGPYAYKIKKPVNFGFVDYSTLEKRQHFCRLEVELNRRFAEDLYLGVVPIVEQQGSLKVLDETELPKYANLAKGFAVKMRQFPQEAIVAARLQDPQLTSRAVEAFGRDVANFHASIESADPAAASATPTAQVASEAQDNFTVLLGQIGGDRRLSLLKRLEQWTSERSGRLAPKFRQRLAGGNVRRCHGDLHLNNMIQWNGNLIAFDGIEFNEAFQWIDVYSEIAFPVTDFLARDRADLGWRLLNSWLEETGDYADPDVLRFYLVYRAMVRAKVTSLNPKNNDPEVRKKYATADDPERRFAGPWDRYLRTAAHLAFDLKARLTITHGFSGSGKSTVAMQAIERRGGIRIRSDVERHRLARRFGIRDEYASTMSERVYAHLLELAVAATQAGFPVFVDATFLSRQHRLPFLQLARQRSLDFEILDCDAPPAELCQRIRNRGPDPSDATVEVLKQQMASHDPLTADELPFVRKANVQKS